MVRGDSPVNAKLVCNFSLIPGMFCKDGGDIFLYTYIARVKLSDFFKLEVSLRSCIFIDVDCALHYLRK